MNLFNVDNNNMDFKGNPIYGGKLSKKYLKFIKNNPDAPIPSKLLNKTSLKKGVFKLLKRYSNKGFSIINNKLVKSIVGDINELYDSDKYDLGMYFPNGKPDFIEEEDPKGIYINTNEFLYNKLVEYKFKDGEFVRLILTGDVKDKTYVVYDKVSETSITKNMNDLFKNNEGVNLDKNIIINLTFYVPTPSEKDKFNNYRYMWLNSTYQNIIAFLLQEGINCRFVVTKQTIISEESINQKYAEGTEHCLLNPILLWAKEMLNDPKGKKKDKYITIINKIEGKELKTGEKKIGYYEKYKKGIPENEIQDLCDDLRLKITLEYPLRKDGHNKEFISNRKPLKTFSYVNTRYNHVEQLTTTNYKDMVDDQMNQDELNIKFNELQYNEEYFIFGRSRYGISWIQTHDKIYKLDSPYERASKRFMDEYNFSNYAIDARKSPDLSKFVDNATHFNGTIDFTEVDKNIYNQDLGHIDIIKAYSQFKKCKYYNGFCGSITDLREVDNFDQVGLYYINGLDFSKANSKFVFYNNKMNWFVNKNIYTDAELRFLTDMKVKFNVKYGAYGIKTDFEFNKEMLTGKEQIGLCTKPKRWNANTKEYEGGDVVEMKISFYAKFIGKCAMINYDKKISMFGEKDYFKKMKDDSNRIYYDDMYKEATIMYPRKRVIHYKHISAQVVAYQRLNLIEQLMKMNEDKIIRVCVDGIYYKNHDFIKDDIFQDKSHEMTFINSPSENYLSNIFNKTCSISGVKFGRKRDFIKNLCVIGGGGNGKSTREFMDYGHSNVLYLAPSWKLSAKVLDELSNNKVVNLNDNIDVNVYHRYLYMDFEYGLQKRYNVILCDEASQLTEQQKRILLNVPNKKNIFLGDVGFQLEPVIDYKELRKVHAKKKIQISFFDWIKKQGHYEMNLKGFDKVEELTTDYRASCDKLKDMKKTLREYIIKERYSKDKNKITKEALDYVKSIIPKGDINNMYRRTDMILSSTHTNIMKYNKMFSHLEKYLVKQNTRTFKNGQIVFEKPKGVKVMKYKGQDTDVNHSYTIHAIQGETLGKDDKLFIDFDNMFSGVRMIYTAISRARRLEQIFLI